MAASPTPGPVDDLTFYRALRSRMEREDDLIINRLSWLMAMQSFLFTAYAIVTNAMTLSVLEGIRRQQSHLVRLIPLVGFASSALIYAGILAAIRALMWLRSHFRARGIDEASLGLPPIQTPRPMLLGGLAAPLALPVIFMFVWIYLLATPPG